MTCLEQAREHCFLLSSGLGSYVPMTAAFSASRCDHSLLMAAVTAPTVRVNLIHRLQECLEADGASVFLSTQGFADGPPRGGFPPSDLLCLGGRPGLDVPRPGRPAPAAVRHGIRGQYGGGGV